MAKALLLLYLIAAICAATMSRAATIVPVSLKLLTEIHSNRTIPCPWVIRFSTPTGQTEKERQSFADAAMVVDSSVANFGHFVVDTYDKARMVEALGIRSLPITRYAQFQSTRPSGPKTLLSGRVAFMLNDVPASVSSEEIVRYVYTNSPMRYNHPLTNQPIPSVTYALQLSDLADRARQSLPAASPADAAQHTLSVLGGGANAKAVIFYFHLMKKNHLNIHAEINSIASRMGPRVTVFATEDADIARRFGLTQPFSAAAFYLKDVNIDLTIDKTRKAIDGTQIVPQFPERIYTIATADELGNAGDSAAFAAEHALAASEYDKLLTNELGRWHKDVSALFHKSPLVKLSHSSQFRAEVMENKAHVSVIFMLREADRHFNRYHRTAIDFALFARDPYRVAPGIYAKLHPNLQFQSFWIDGEVQSEASRFLNTKAVPSVAILMHAKDGLVAVKYFTYSDEDKKRRKKKGQDTEWPDVQDLMAYLASDSLLVGAPGMSQFSDGDIKFNDEAANDGPANANAVDHNHRYLHADRKHNALTGDPKPNTFLADLEAGRIVVEADHYAKEGGEEGEGKEKKQKKKKISAKEEARRAKLQEDIDRKKREREERTKAKEEEDRKRREVEAKQTKKAITKKARAAKKKKGSKKGAANAVSGGSDGADNGAGFANVEGESVSAPPLAPNRVKKDWNQWKKEWEGDSRRMVDKFVKNVKGGVRVGKGLTAPDWRKK